MAREAQQKWQERIDTMSKAQLAHELGQALGRVAQLETALRKIVTGPDGKYDHESGCPFERFACSIAHAVLRNSEHP